MKVSVIVSAYNRPHFLRLALYGYSAQTDRDFELVIADDGSGPEVLATVAAVGTQTGLDWVHVWHADDGFRKTVILNRAIVAATGEYLIFTDGDCIPRSDMIRTHMDLARSGRYIAGGYLKLPQEVSETITADDVLAGRTGELRWLRSAGWSPGRRALRLLRGRPFPALLDAITPTAADFHGNNASAFRPDLLHVNGFEGLMGYGGEDQALGYRLANAGIRGLQARHRAVTMHLHHDRPYRIPEVVARNKEIMRTIRRSGAYEAVQGIRQLPPDPSLRITRRT